MENDNQRLLRKEEVAFQLQISVRTLDKMIASGLVKPVIVGTQKRFPESLLQQLKKTVAATSTSNS